MGEAPGDSAVSSSGECRSRCKTANSTPIAKYRPTGPTVAINRVLTWNLHGLHGVKILQLMNKMHSMRPDVVVATETELQDENPPSIPGYISMVPKTLVSSKVRTVMYTRRELQAEQLSTPRDVPIVAARIGNSAIVGLYRQFKLISKTDPAEGKAFEAQQFEAIESVIRTVSNDYKTMHVCGDINLDPTRTEDAEYYQKALLRKWCNVTEELGLVWAKTGPTFRSDGLFNGEHRYSTIDLMYSRCAGTTEASVLPDSPSDHSPVYAVKKGATQTCKPKRETRQDRNWKNTNTTALDLSFRDWDWGPLLCSTDVNKAVSLLKAASTAAINVAVPLRTYTTPNLGVRLKADTLKAMRMRDKAKRNGALHYKALRNKALSLVRRDYVTNNLERIRKGGQDSAWKIAAEVMGKSKTSSLPRPPECKTDEDASNQCNQFYIDKVKRLRKDLNSNPTIKAKAFGGPKFEFHSVGTASVRQAIKKVQAKPACGVDGVPITIYKAAQETILLPLVHVVNLILKSGVWPSEWKRAIITPTLKPGYPASQISSYRPVAILCAVSKVAERIMHDQMEAFLEENSLIPHQQHGFRRQRGVNTALTSMLCQVGRAQDRGLKVGIEAYDYSAAFDTVSLQVLESKLSWAGPTAKSLLKSYMVNRVQQVKWNTALSEVLAVEFGVPQGSVLAPLLFIIVTGDLPESVMTQVEPSASVGVSQYADDTTGYAAEKTWENTEKAQDIMASNLESYSKNNGLHLNPNKTQKLKLGHKDTTSSDSLNILGVTLDRLGGFSIHNERVHSDLRKRLGMVRCLAVQLPRGKLLNEIGSSLIVGRLQSSAFITRHMRLNAQNNDQVNKGPAQVVLNDLARVLLGVRRADHYRVADLVDKSGLPTVNEVVVRQSAISAWKAVNGGALGEVLEKFDDRSRGSACNLRRPASQRCLPAVNMASAWNSCEALRKATTLSEARSVAKKIAREARHA